MITEVFLLIILWEDESKVLLVPDIFFELDDEIDEKMWLEWGLIAENHLVSRLNVDSWCSLRWLANLEEEKV